MNGNSATEPGIRQALRADADLLLDLITALANFENLPPPDSDARDRLIEHGFGEHPKYRAYLAEQEGKAVGYAFVVETYSTFLARPTLYLEDLFVLPDYRRQGIGRALLHFCMKLALAEGCGRMEWTCLDWNVNAQRVYEELGAVQMSDWYLYRMTQETIDAFLKTAGSPERRDL